MTINTDPKEEKLYKRYRIAENEYHTYKAKKQELVRNQCEHSFKHVGHSHNDDAYECSICGLIKFE